MLTPATADALRSAKDILSSPSDFLRRLEKEIDSMLVQRDVYDSRKDRIGAAIPAGIGQVLAAEYRAAGWVVEQEPYRFQQKVDPGYADPDGSVRGYTPELDFPAMHLLVRRRD